MADRYVDSSAPGGGTGTISNPWNSFAQWAGATIGDRIIFRGSTNPATPRHYLGGGIFTPKNFTLKAYPGEFIRFTNTAATGSLLTFEVWTGGLIDATEGGIEFRDGNPNNPADGSYFKGLLQLTGCTGLALDGGEDRLLLFAGNSDIGLYMTDYPGGGHGAARGCRDSVVQNFETRDLATGVLVRSSGTSTVNPLGGQGVILQDFSCHHHSRMLDQRNIGTDAGGVGFTFFACDGTIARRFTAYENHANDTPGDYVEDGGGFEIFGAKNYLVEDFVMWQNEGGIETGRSGNIPLGTGGVIRRGTIYGSSNMHTPRQEPPRSPTILLRDFEDGRLEHMTIYSTDTNEVIQLYHDTGTFGGSIKRAKIQNNNLVLAQNSSRSIFRVGGGSSALPTGADAPTIDYNNYFRPVGGTVIGNDATPGGFGNRTWAQWPARLAALGVVGAEAHGKNVDPLMVDPGSQDFRLQSGSPLIDAGVVIAGYSYSGLAPDIGAFEGSSPIRALDDFNRTVADGWGSAQAGGAYAITNGPAANFDVAAGVGTINLSAAATHRANLSTPQAQSALASVKVKTASLPVGGNLNLFVYVRTIGATSTTYRVQFSITPAGAVSIALERWISGVKVTLATASVPRETWVANTDFNLKVLASGINPTVLTAKVWRASTSEPGTWDVTGSNSDAALQVPGGVGLGGYLDTGSAILVTWDDLQLLEQSNDTLGAASVAGVASTTANAGLKRPGSAAVSGVATATGAPTVRHGGSGALAGVATATGAPTMRHGGAGVAAGVAAAAGSGRLVHGATASVVGEATATGSGAVTKDATTAITGEASVVASGSVLVGGAASALAAASVVGGGSARYGGAAALGASALVNASPSALLSTASALAAAAVIVGSPLVTNFRDTFTRSATDSWGTADQGGSWTVNTAAPFDVNGSKGLMTAGANNTRRCWLASVVGLDVDATVTCQTDKVFATAGFEWTMSLRQSHIDNDMVLASFKVNSSGRPQLALARRVGGSQTTEVSDFSLDSGHGHDEGDYASGTDYKMRFRATGSNPTTIEAKAWKASNPEPSHWCATSSVTSGESTPIQSAGAVGLRCFVGGTYSNGTVTFSFDDLQGDIAAAGVTHSGSASVSAAASVVAIPSVKLPGAASVAASAAVSATGSFRHDGTAAVVASAAVAGSAGLIVPGSAAVAGIASSVAAPSVVTTGAASVVGAAAAAGNPALIAGGSASLVGQANAVGDPTIAHEGAASLLVAASVEGAGSLLVAGLGEAVAEARLDGNATAILDGSASVLAIAEPDATPSAIVAGDTLIEALAELQAIAELALGASANVTAVAALVGAASVRPTPSVLRRATVVVTPARRGRVE